MCTHSDTDYYEGNLVCILCGVVVTQGQLCNEAPVYEKSHHAPLRTKPMVGPRYSRQVYFASWLRTLDFEGVVVDHNELIREYKDFAAFFNSRIEPFVTRKYIPSSYLILERLADRLEFELPDSLKGRIKRRRVCAEFKTLPSEIQYHGVQSLAPSVRTTLSLNSEGSSAFTAPGQVARFTVPYTSGSFSDFMNGGFTGRITFAGAAVAASDANGLPTKAFGLLGNANSLFESQTTSMAGTQLEMLSGGGLITQQLHEVYSSTAELDGQSIQMLFDQRGEPGAVCGHTFNHSAAAPNNNSTTFAIPFLGALGSLTQAIPCTNELVIELTIADILGRRLVNLGSIPTSFVIDNLQCHVDSLRFEGAYAASLANEKIMLKCSTVLYNTATIPAGAIGDIDVAVLSRAQSAKKLMLRFSNSQDASGKSFSSSNPNARSMSLYNNGLSYPQTPIRTALPAVCRLFSQRAAGSVGTHDHPGSINLDTFSSRYTAYTLHVGPVAMTNYGNRATSGQWSLMIDLESLSGGKQDIWQGLPMSASSASFLRMNVTDALAGTVTVHMMLHVDALLVIEQGTARLIY
ncbi:hypothetical protein B484DRAFT_429317 [Ochromonadaceae sp. CCMP2298]|nr:hypothetical protein B484DRAFT_430137 [Ochromonadaceae sp. CCMP2298]KAJ1434140.1 hypothetical protein B484DRAFT_429317 [Ochromonadaceae sp. CCMP2298]